MLRLFIGGVSGCGAFWLGSSITVLHNIAVSYAGLNASYLILGSIAVGLVAYRASH